MVGESRATIGGGAALVLTRPDGVPVGRIPVGATATVALAGQELRIQVPGGVTLALDAAVVSVEDTGHVRVGDREYRGVLDLLVVGAGLTVVN
ncbi:MAG: hypothetical protein KJZ47_02260, partial [Gemmatimonadales bacterium]|nr:hypothetical protein [Gemmatimonadales bacterium]